MTIEDCSVADGRNHACFMHCLPPVHDSRTVPGRRVLDQYGLEGSK